jgi:regulator of replication initiation timing
MKIANPSDQIIKLKQYLNQQMEETKRMQTKAQNLEKQLAKSQAKYQEAVNLKIAAPKEPRVAQM